MSVALSPVSCVTYLTCELRHLYLTCELRHLYLTCELRHLYRSSDWPEDV